MLLFFSAFFSSSETALFSLSEPEIENFKTTDRRKKKFLKELLHNPGDILTTILLSNTITNVGFSFLFSLLFFEIVLGLHWNLKVSMLIDTIIITTLLLVFGEFSPKFYALKRTKNMTEKSIIPLFYVMIFVRPFVFLLNFINKRVIALVKHKQKKDFSFDEIKTLFEIGEKEGIFKENEKKIISSLFTLTESVVSEIMVPRTEVVSIDGNMTIKDAYPVLVKYSYSRIPVYTGDEKNMKGVLYLKDFLVHREEADKKIVSLIRSPLFLPENMRLKDAFYEFRKHKMHFAIVVNEFGGMEGIVTMNDILKEIIGNIKDEYHREDIPLYRYISKDELLVDGSLKIKDFPASFYPNFPAGDYETVSGFVLAQMGRVPKEDEFFIFKDLVFTVLKVSGRKPGKILIRKKHIFEKDREVL